MQAGKQNADDEPWASPADIGASNYFDSTFYAGEQCHLEPTPGLFEGGCVMALREELITTVLVRRTNPLGWAKRRHQESRWGCYAEHAGRAPTTPLDGERGQRGRLPFINLNWLLPIPYSTPSAITAGQRTCLEGGIPPGVRVRPGKGLPPGVTLYPFAIVGSD